MTKRLNLCDGRMDLFTTQASGEATDLIVCEAICPHPVLYTRAVWTRWNAWMRMQAKVFVKEWARDNPLLLAMLMQNERQLSRYDLRRIRTPKPLLQHRCKEQSARWSVSLDGARVQTERRMIDRLADALAAMGGREHE